MSEMLVIVLIIYLQHKILDLISLTPDLKLILSCIHASHINLGQ